MKSIQLPRLNDIDNIIQGVIQKYATRIFNDAMSNVRSQQVRSSFRLEIGQLRAEIYSNNELAAYIEFGTGDFAAQYLGGQPQEVRDEAIKFYVNGQGRIPASPYLFPVFYKYRDEMVREADASIQKYFDSL